MEPEISSPNIDLNESSMSSYVLTKLFLEATRKFGQHKAIKSMDYNYASGLTVVDEDDVVWSLEVNARVKFPRYLDNLPNARVQDSEAKVFCTSCSSGIAHDFEFCSFCEYLRRI